MRTISKLVFAAACIALGAGAAAAQEKLAMKPMAEKKLAVLPAGPLFWRIETFPTLAQAQEKAGPTALAGESGGKAWLVTLGAAGGPSSGGETIAEVGPIEPITAPEYLLRVHETTGAPGAMSPVHSHPGSEAFYVLAGEQSIRSPEGTARTQPGSFLVGRGSGVPMQVTSSGTSDLHMLVLFVLDATQPFSSPAELK